ncbi:MAG: HlyD family secretion protein [Defluviitaleaceae bacterium]|nr:HlyD family secretion protein [Defluviitaleaceae bacterium]
MDYKKAAKPHFTDNLHWQQSIRHEAMNNFLTYKKILTRITIAFVLVILFLTFFSRTLSDLHVPRVTIDFVERGTISPEARSSGIVRATDTERIFAPVSGRITQIVQVGDIVNAQTVLFTIATDMRVLTEMSDNAEHDRRVMLLNIERTQSEISSEQQLLLQSLAAPVTIPIAPTLSLLEYDLQLENNERALILQLEANASATERAREELERLQILYAQNIIPRLQLIDGENEVSQLAQAREQIIAQYEQAQEQVNLRRELAISRHEAAIVAFEDTVETARRNNESQIQSHRNRISQLEFTLTALSMELERLEIQIYDLAEQIAAGGIVEVRIPSDANGARTIMEHDIEIGSQITEGAAILQTALNNGYFYIEASFPQAQDFISINQNATILVGTERLTGRTTRVVPQGGRNNVTISVQSDMLRGGEMVSVIVSGGSTNHANTIPISALREDSTGYFVLYVESVPQRFGRSYYLRARRIEAGRRDSSSVAISSIWGMGIPYEPIVINSDIPVHADMRVRIVGGSDFAYTR